MSQSDFVCKKCQKTVRLLSHGTPNTFRRTSGTKPTHHQHPFVLSPLFQRLEIWWVRLVTVVRSDSANGPGMLSSCSSPIFRISGTVSAELSIQIHRPIECPIEYDFSLFSAKISKSSSRGREAMRRWRFLIFLRSDSAHSKSIVEHDLPAFTGFNTSIEPFKTHDAS